MLYLLLRISSKTKETIYDTITGILGFIAFILVIYTCVKLFEYSEIRKQGGIRVRFSNFFKFFYNLPHSQKTYESKRLVKFVITDSNKVVKVCLRYTDGDLVTKVKVTYLDDTSFPNGQTYKNKGGSETDLSTIKEFFQKLP